MPGSDWRAALLYIFGSVPTALTGVSQALFNSGEVVSPWHPPQYWLNRTPPCCASCALMSDRSLGHCGDCNTAIFSSRVCRPAKSTELFLKEIRPGTGVFAGENSPNTPNTSPELRA